MKNLILPFLVAVLLGIGACDDSTINPKDDNKDTTDKDTTLIPVSSIKEDIIGVDEIDSLGKKYYGIYVVNIDGSGKRQISPFTFSNGIYCKLSPDKTALLVAEYVSTNTSRSYLYRIYIDSNVIDTIDATDGYFSWMPDSKFFIYSKDKTLYLSEGKTTTNIGEMNDYHLPLITSDGSKFIYFDKNSIYSTNRFGQQKEEIWKAPDSCEIKQIKLSGDSKNIAFVLTKPWKSYITYTLNTIELDGTKGSEKYTIITPYFFVGWTPDKEKFFVIEEASLKTRYQDTEYSNLLEILSNGNTRNLFSSYETQRRIFNGESSKDGQYVLINSYAGTQIINTATKAVVSVGFIFNPEWIR